MCVCVCVCVCICTLDHLSLAVSLYYFHDHLLPFPSPSLFIPLHCTPLSLLCLEYKVPEVLLVLLHAHSPQEQSHRLPQVPVTTQPMILVRATNNRIRCTIKEQVTHRERSRRMITTYQAPWASPQNKGFMKVRGFYIPAPRTGTL